MMRFSSTPTDIDAGYRSGDDFMHVDGAPVTDILQLVSSLEGGGGGGELKAQYETWTRTLLLQLLPCLPNHERDAEQGASSVLTVGAGGGGPPSSDSGSAVSNGVMSADSPHLACAPAHVVVGTGCASSRSGGGSSTTTTTRCSCRRGCVSVLPYLLLFSITPTPLVCVCSPVLTPGTHPPAQGVMRWKSSSEVHRVYRNYL